MSKNDVCDTTVEQQPIIEVCTACTSQHKPQGDMQHFIRPHCQERESAHTSQSVPATHCRARVTFSRTEPPKKTLCKRLCVLVLHCFHPDDMKKVNMETSPCRQDPFQKFRRNRDGTFVFDNCQQIWFEFLRTRVDEVRRTRTGNHTSPTLQWKTARVYIHWRILLVSPWPTAAFTVTSRTCSSRASHTQGIGLHLRRRRVPTCWRVSTA